MYDIDYEKQMLYSIKEEIDSNIINRILDPKKYHILDLEREINYIECTIKYKQESIIRLIYEKEKLLSELNKLREK